MGEICSFGKSSPPEEALKHFGSHEELVATKVGDYLKRWVTDEAKGEWTNL